MITSRDNELIKDIIKLTSSSKHRRERQLFVAEGLRLCRDAALSGVHIVDLIYTEEAAMKSPENFERLSQAADRRTEVSKNIFAKIADTAAPQGFLCLIDRGSVNALNKPLRGRKYAALENIQDPSNLGTILRTAEALGLDGVILSEGCCDVFSPKVVRGSMGAVFRLPIGFTDDMAVYVEKAAEEGIVSYASTPHEADNAAGIDYSEGGLMLIGNEGNGLQTKTIEACTRRVRIEMAGRAESLNASAAAAILMYEMMRSVR